MHAIGNVKRITWQRVNQIKIVCLNTEISCRESRDTSMHHTYCIATARAATRNTPLLVHKVLFRTNSQIYIK